MTAGSLSVLSRLGALHPSAHPERHGVRRQDDRYGAAAWQRLDWYVPSEQWARPLPVCVYLHGGGFQKLSKDTHWMMGLMLARRGYVAAVPDYRLAPAHPYPAALEDCLLAVRHAVATAADRGGDPTRLVLAGESAGASLAVAAALAASDPPDEAYARAFAASDVSIGSVLAWSGLYQVIDPDRYVGRASSLVCERLRDIEACVVTTELARTSPLCNPLRYFEDGAGPCRFPPTFLAVGTRDSISDDTERLGEAMARRGVDVDLRVYPGGVHGFHALAFHELARRSWDDALQFSDRHLAMGR